MVVIEHLERRTLLAASAAVDGDAATVIDRPVEQAAAAATEASVPTRVVVEFERGNEHWTTTEVIVRAFVTALRNTDGTYVPVASIGSVKFFREGRGYLASEAVPVKDGMAEVRVELRSGSHTLRAQYDGEGDYLSSTSEPVEGDARRSVGLSIAEGVTYVKAMRAVTLTARVLSIVSDKAPLGKVTFHGNGGNLLGVAAVTNLRATVQVVLPAGKHRITASYSGDARHRGAESRTQTIKAHAGEIVDLMVAYTPAAAAAMEDADGVRREIVRAVESVNLVLRKSRVPVAVRLVGAVPVQYEETRNYERDLKRMAASMDGHLDDVEIQRQRFGADLVSLFVGEKGKGDVAGMAYRMMRTGDPANERLPFSVVHAMSAAGPNYVLAHELAHGFGAAHDEENAPNARVVAPYSHGFKGFVDGEQVRDVMGYPPGRTLPYFSNPRITYGGVRLGHPRTADVSRLIEETVPIVASYRDEKVPWGETVICPACR